MSVIKKLFAAAVLGFAAMHAGATTLSFQASASTGGGTDVNVVVSDITDLFGYGFYVDFDPGFLSATSLTFGSFLGTDDTALQFFTDLNPGFYVVGALYGPVPGINGSGTLMTIHFDGLAAGTSFVNFSDILLLDSNIDDIAATIVGDTLAITTAEVPEPASALLLGIGAVAFIARRRGARTSKIAA
jgi:hypothetical protein